MRYKLSAICFLLFAATTVFCQVDWRHNRDSLLNVLSTSKEDSNKVAVMLSIGMAYQANNPDSALYYFKALGDLSKKLNYTRGIVTYLNMTAGILGKQHKIEEAIALDSQAFVIASATHNQRLIGRSYINLANAYRLKGEYNRTLGYYLKALDISEQLHDSLSLASLGINMANVYKNLREYDKAAASALKGVALSKAIHNNNLVNSALTSLSGALIESRRYDTALVVLQDSKMLSQQLNDIQNAVYALINIGSLYDEKYMFSMLKGNATELMALSKQINSIEGQGDAMEELFAYYFYMRDYVKAKMFALQEIDLVLKNDVITLVGPAYQNLALAELMNGDFTAFKRYSAMNDSITSKLQSDEITRNSQELEAKYSLDKKQTQIDNLDKQNAAQRLILRQRNTINWVLSGAVLAFLLAGFFYYRNNQQKNKLKQQRITELEKEKQLLAATSVLQGQEEERKRLAKDLHDGLGGILSSVKYSFTNMKNNLIITPEGADAFDRSMVMLDKSISELRNIAHNMMPEALMNLGLDSAVKDFCQNINQSGAIELTYQSFNLADDTVSKNKASVVYRIIQELVNNILKHAGATTALIQIIKKEDTLSITVEDNGKGFDTNKLQDNSGIGFINLQNRVTYLGGTLDVQTAPGKGTSVNIEIPNVTA